MKMKNKYITLSSSPEISVVVPHGQMKLAREILAGLDENGSTSLYIRAFQDAGFDVRDEREGDDLEAVAAGATEMVKSEIK